MEQNKEYNEALERLFKAKGEEKQDYNSFKRNIDIAKKALAGGDVEKLLEAKTSGGEALSSPPDIFSQEYQDEMDSFFEKGDEE